MKRRRSPYAPALGGEPSLLPLSPADAKPFFVLDEERLPAAAAALPPPRLHLQGPAGHSPRHRAHAPRVGGIPPSYEEFLPQILQHHARQQRTDLVHSKLHLGYGRPLTTDQR